MKVNTLVAAAVAALATVSAQADKVTLTSGSTLTGTAGILNGDKLEFKSDDLGDLKIDVAKIAKLESDRDHVVKYKDNSTETKPVTVTDGKYALRDGKALDMSNVKEIDPAVEAWHGSVNLSASMIRGNTVSETVALSADAARRWEHDRFTANGGYYFAQSGDSKATKRKTESRFEIQAQEDHFWSDCLYNYVNGKYEFDRIMDLDRRLRIGVGFGYQWLENAKLGIGKVSFNQEVGAAWVSEKYEGAYDDDYATLRYAHHLAWDPGSIENFAFTHNFEYLPDFGDWADNYIIDTDVGCTYAFSINWQILAKIEWDYKSQVAPGVKNSDFRYMLGVGYRW